MMRDSGGQLSSKPSPGVFVVSLDFEMAWGMHDNPDPNHYRSNLEGERAAIDRLLSLFETYGIHATWATVGFLFFSRKQDLLAHLPSRQPAYAEPIRSPYRLLDAMGSDEAVEPTRLAGGLLDRIKVVPGQEIGTHTFSHYFCLEPGQTIEDFREDLRAAVRIAEERGFTLKSLVFPRNQCNEAYLAVCREFGIVSYRGNESSWMYRASGGEDERPWRRAARLLDAYLPLSGSNTYPLASIKNDRPFNIPSSRFLRPHLPSLAFLEPLRLWRIKRNLRRAADRGEVYHLWWHPHNFGINAERNFAFLEEILKEVDRLRADGRLVSLNMNEIAERV